MAPWTPALDKGEATSRRPVRISQRQEYSIPRDRYRVLTSDSDCSGQARKSCSPLVLVSCAALQSKHTYIPDTLHPLEERLKPRVTLSCTYACRRLNLTAPCAYLCRRRGSGRCSPADSSPNPSSHPVLRNLDVIAHIAGQGHSIILDHGGHVLLWRCSRT